DLDNACAKSRVLEALLAQAVAMQIISTLGLSCCRRRKRGTSGRWRQSAPGLCSAKLLIRNSRPVPMLCCKVAIAKNRRTKVTRVHAAPTGLLGAAQWAK